MKRYVLLSSGLVLSISAFAQAPATAAGTSGSGNWELDGMTIALLLLAVIILLASLAMLRAFSAISQEMANPRPFETVQKPRMLEYEEWVAQEKTRKADRPSIWTWILGLRPLSEEKDIMIEHEFDGISELDNPTPAWFMVLFYGTIAFAVVYMSYYHVFNLGPLQDEEYVIEMKAAEEEKAVRLANSANNIDENSVKLDAAPNVISAGKAIYDANCVACHGDALQGTVGPNLVDEYWLHGGEVGDVFKTIKYGVPAKGMISWEKTLSPKQISDVANYILSLQGSNPANAKAPQGAKKG